MNKHVQNRFDTEVNKWQSVHDNPKANLIAWEIYNRKLHTIRTLLRQYKGKPIKILEIGCGAGKNIEALLDADRKWQCHGVDISPKMIETCRSTIKNRRASFGVLNIDKTTLKKKFDVIILLGVVGYIDDHAKAFVNIDKMLKENGHLIFTYGNKRSLNRKVRHSLINFNTTKTGNNIINTYRKITGKESLDRKGMYFKLYTNKQVRSWIPKYTVQRVFNIGFTPGLTKYAAGISAHIEKFWSTKDPLSLGFTRLVVAKK